jgi:hypothetical protein
MRQPTETDVERLREIKESILELLEEARQIVRGTSEEERARSYWYGHIRSSIDDEHMYVGRTTTIDDTIETLQEQLLETNEDETEAE